MNMSRLNIRSGTEMIHFQVHFGFNKCDAEWSVIHSHSENSASCQREHKQFVKLLVIYT